jgi:DNA-binding GntR family transcriptional regulator
MMKKLRRSSLSSDAYAFVRALFLDEDRYRAGGKVSVEALSRELGVSRTPVWGAIYRLEAEGIVEIVPRHGVYLINYDPSKAIEIYVTRSFGGNDSAAGSCTDNGPTDCRLANEYRSATRASE